MGKEKVICMELNSFANRCGYFHNAYLTDDFSYNNGYNCRHPRQEEQAKDEETGKCFGGCFGHSCPLGYPPDADDLVNFGMISEEEAAQDYVYGESDSDYIVVTDVDTIKKFRQMGITGLAQAALGEERGKQ